MPFSDQQKLQRLLTLTGRRNLVLAKGLLSALDAGGASHADVQALAQLLEKANQRITDEKEPFTTGEKKQLEELFVRSYISPKTAHWFATQTDEFLLTEIDEFISGRRMMTVPAKKTVTMDIEKKKQKKARA